MNKARRLSFFATLIDIVSLVVSFLLGSYLYLIIIKKDIEFYNNSFFLNFSIFIIAFIFSESISNKKNRKFLERTSVQEFFNVIKLSVYIALSFSAVTFITKSSTMISRGTFFSTLIIFLIVSFVFRSTMKVFVKKNIGNLKTNMIIVTSFESAIECQYFSDISKKSLHEVVGLIIVDKDMEGQSIKGFDVVSNLNGMTTFFKTEPIDSVLFMIDSTIYNDIIDEITSIISMGIIVHLGIEGVVDKKTELQNSINYFGGYPALSFAEASQSEEQRLVKRVFDLIGGLLGSLFTVIVAIFLGPLIKLESKGPIFFKQQRVGKNGRYFNIYKFRSMGLNAEKQKKELMKYNEVEGHMFKMTNDPRVTRIGKFIRATSIDELPQFFNVLRGEMSLVGTRPPTIDEYMNYQMHHKRRLSMRPGITGMWQVSGRSDITDFEEVVHLDTEYIDNYSFALDIKILLKTVVVVIAKVGSR